ncbi:RNA exonuclease 4 [Camellia sinensis]|uniref:RNA exonuclease 4 n=1 Tax=Camellia sinensis TaxID=4442 RepID=UPI0010361645|nr:RNA exonuclease 4 [Camellia sinensis]
MGSELRNPKKQPQLNPNWAQLCKKLKSHGTKPYSKATEKSESETPKSVLGKRKERSNAESDDSMPNPLVPTSSDCSYFFSLVRCFVGNRSTSVTDAIAMDCEMVGVSPLGNKSALGRVTLVNKCGNVIYDEYVRPVDRVVDFRTEISGIRPRDLRKAKEFRLVQKKVAELIKGRILVGHALRNDLRALLLSHSKKDLRDTSEYQPFLKEGRSKALRHLAAEFLGVKIQNGEHCPVEDARAAMLLYQKYKKEWEKSIKDFIRLKEKQKKRKQKKKPKEGEAVNLNHPKTVS